MHEQPEPVLTYTIKEFAEVAGRFADIGWKASELHERSKPKAPAPAFAFTPTEKNKFDRAAEYIEAVERAIAADPACGDLMKYVAFRPVPRQGPAYLRPRARRARTAG